MRGDTIRHLRGVRRRAQAFAAVVAVCAAAATLHGQAAGVRDLIWKASGARGSIYLVGSMHLLTREYYPLGASLERAFSQSKLLVEELDYAEMLDPTAQLQMLSRGMLPSGQSLDKVLSPATYALVNQHMTRLGVPIEPLSKFKPWMLALTILGLEWQKAGFDPDLGLDKHFYDRAQKLRTPVQGLETLALQISMFDDMPAAQQDRLLAETLKEIDTERASLIELADAWKAGNVSVIERAVLKDVKQEPDVYRRLLVERNRAWMPKIEALFSRPDPSFVVVGAAHLVGPDGLVAMLKAKGYSVEQQ